jgi:hypothetical protein
MTPIATNSTAVVEGSYDDDDDVDSDGGTMSIGSVYVSKAVSLVEVGKLNDGESMSFRQDSSSSTHLTLVCALQKTKNFYDAKVRAAEKKIGGDGVMA